MTRGEPPPPRDYAERRTEVSDITVAGDRTVGRLLWHVRARHSGIESDLELWFANRLVDSQLIEQRFFWTRAEALTAAGVPD